MKRILVIDDDVSQRGLFKAALEEANYTVIVASDGIEGVELYRQQPCDLVITDIFMEEQGGLETIVKLKGDFPSLKIIAVSGGTTWDQIDDNIARYFGYFDADEALETAQDVGASRILGKPVEIPRLLEIVDELLGGPN